MIGISKNAAYECIRRGEIPAKHFGRRIVILRSDITALLTADNEHEN